MATVEQAIVLCGGRGTRLGSTRQKCMSDVHGEPFLNYVLRNLQRRGIKRVVLAVNHRAQDVTQHYASKTFAGMALEFSTQTGTGPEDAVRCAAEGLEGPTAVVNGDTVFDCPLLIASDLNGAMTWDGASIPAGTWFGPAALFRSITDGSMSRPDQTDFRYSIDANWFFCHCNTPEDLTNARAVLPDWEAAQIDLG